MIFNKKVLVRLAVSTLILGSICSFNSSFKDKKVYAGNIININDKVNDDISANTNDEQMAFAVTPESLVNDEKWEEENDPLYEKYNSIAARLNQSSKFTSLLKSSPFGDGLIHDPRFDNYEKIYGIDISKWQNERCPNKAIDWNAVKADGINFVIIRLGYRARVSGSLTLDPYFDANIVGAHEAGLNIGVYFYTQAITEEEAKAEADFCADKLALYEGYLSYPVIYDIENTATDRMGLAGVTTEQRTAFCKAFCDQAIARGYETGIYASMYYFLNSLNADTFSTQYHNWLARYTKAYNTGNKIYNGAYEMWQFTDNDSTKSDRIIKSVNGIVGPVDLNVAYKVPCTFTWSPDFSSCTVRTYDENGVEQEVPCEVAIVGDTAPSCVSQGVRVLQATYGNYYDTQSVVYGEPTGHTEVFYEEVAATCTEVGYRGGSYCATCGAEIQARETVPAQGHIKVVVKRKSATYLKKGYTGDSVCDVCGAMISKGKSIAAKKLSKNTVTSVKSTKKKKLTLKWKKNIDASGYQIQYSSHKSCSKLSKIVTVSSRYKTTKTLSCNKSKTKYYVRVRAYKSGRVNGKKKIVYGSWSKIKSVKVK